MKKIALLIGISEYQPGFNVLPGSVKDVEALKEVLKDRKIGGFQEVKTLLNPDLQTMQSEIELLFTEANREDLVLLYFSGHGIKDDTGKLYFATSTTRKNQKNQPIKATMVPAHFVHEMMSSARARRQGIVLDCCFSGAFDPSLSVKDDGSIDLRGQLGAEGRVVMASSNHVQTSFGATDSIELSAYTSHIVEGLKTGEADLDKDGVVSVRDLHCYVSNKTREHSPNTTPKLITFKDMGFDIILAKSPIAGKKKPYSRQTVDFGPICLPVSNGVDRRDYLPNFLTPYETLIQDLSCSLQEQAISLGNREFLAKADLESVILNMIQDSSKASFVLVLENDAKGKLVVSAQSDFLETDNIQQLITTLKTKILPIASLESIFNPKHHGIYKKCLTNEEDLHSVFVFVPLSPKQTSKFMIIAGIPDSSSYLGDAYGKIVASFYNNCQQFAEHPDLVEAAIIDALKKDYKFLSLELYNRRFKLFCDRLLKMTVYFEPILELDSLTISGWEALARDPQTAIAPYDLFQAAELWGVQFMIELDQHFLRVAAEKYRTGRKETKQNRSQDILPLSVNVYPESLTREAYFKTVEKVVKGEGLIPGKKLILEISEKISLPQYSSDKGPKASWIGFKKQLFRYVRELQIKFAIDDFGVEHASVSQLAGLKTPYIKVDREILFHESRDIIINFVHDLGGSNTLSPANIILEGIDKDSPVSLSHLKEIGVNYIQGYIVNKAQPQIYRLSEEKIEELRDLLLVG